MSFEPIILVKDGAERTVESPSALVSAQWDGWRPQGTDAPADVVELAKPFNPAEHSADEVIAYLAEADEDEKIRVAEDEETGAARVTVLRAAGVAE